MQRDSLKNKSYFDAAIQDIDNDLAEYWTDIQNPGGLSPRGRMGVSSGLVRFTLDRLQYCYCRGDKLSDSNQDLLNLLKFREMQRFYADALPEEDHLHRVDCERLTLDRLYETLWWLTFAVCLNFDKAYCLKVIELVDNDGLDSLLDCIAIKLGDTDRPLSKKLLYPKTFKGLLDVLNATCEQQPRMLEKYLDNWHEVSKSWGWNDLHLIADGFAYRGYWSFEAALVVKLFNIDDSSFRNHQYYPAAMVHGD